MSDNNNINMKKVEDINIPLDEAVKKFERELIAKTLQTQKSIRQTAKVLGVSHTTIMNKIKKYGL